MNNNEEIKKIVIARLETLSPNRKISIGSSGEFVPADLVEHVKNGDTIGKKFIQIEMEFLRSLKEGTLL